MASTVALTAGLLLAAAGWSGFPRLDAPLGADADAAGMAAWYATHRATPVAALDPGLAVDAVIDRIVDDTFAVFLVGQYETELVVRLAPAREPDQLPRLVSADGLIPGTRGRLLPMADARGVNSPATYIFIPDAEATRRARDRITEKLEVLRTRASTSRADTLPPQQPLPAPSRFEPGAFPSRRGQWNLGN